MMKKSIMPIIMVCLALATVLSCNVRKGDVPVTHFTGFVDPFTGTGGHGHVFLGANVPFGMVQLGPSQKVKGWDWCSGYHFSDSTLLGFSHTHLSGTGIGDLGDILVLPVCSKEDTTATFSHAREICLPGYYRVALNGSDIEAELTATTRTGFHRYTFPADADTAYVRLDLAYGIGWDQPVETEIVIENDSTVSGSRHSTGWAKDQKIYFTAQFSRPFVTHCGDNENMLFAFGQESSPLLMKVGVSSVSVENAKLNLSAENPGWDFDRIAGLADESWNSQLARIDVRGSDKDKRKFYTALYHTMFAPAVFSDVNGDYRGADGNIYNTGGEFTDYTVFSLWDTYRAAHPLSTLIHPELQNDYAETFINIYRQQGKLPVWHLHGNETDCMIGNPGVIVLGDLILKGFVADTAGAYETMRTSCMLDGRSLAELKKYGYVPYDAPCCEESVAKGLEYAIADDAVAKVAALLGQEDDSVYFSDRAVSYRRYFDSRNKFMRGKSMDGRFRQEAFDPFSAVHRADDYCEGNGWQYVWLVPHDPHGLIRLFGSDESFTAKLDSLFAAEGQLGEGASPDISGLIGQYAHGNEPSHHIAYLYNYAGRPSKGAPILRRIMNEMYGEGPEGLCGNEDVGQMSAWFVLSAIGLYQVEPAGGKFVFGTPLFESAIVDVGNGRQLIMQAHDNSAENIYIQEVRLNGIPYDKSYIGFEQIRNGATLEFVMGPVPSETFGTAPHSRP